MKNSLALSVRRVRTSLRTDVNTGPSCGSRSRTQSGGTAYTSGSVAAIAAPPAGGSDVAVAVAGPGPAAAY